MSGERSQMLQIMSDEHTDIHHQIADLRQFWNEVNQMGHGPKYEEMGDRVREFRENLAKHMAREEQGGYLADAVDNAPQLADSARKLGAEHAEFLKTLDNFIGRLNTCESAYQCWDEVRTEFERFIQRLDQHESAEMSLLKQAIANGGRKS